MPCSAPICVPYVYDHVLIFFYKFQLIIPLLKPLGSVAIQNVHIYVGYVVFASAVTSVERCSELIWKNLQWNFRLIHHLAVFVVFTLCSFSIIFNYFIWVNRRLAAHPAHSSSIFRSALFPSPLSFAFLLTTLCWTNVEKYELVVIILLIINYTLLFFSVCLLFLR